MTQKHTEEVDDREEARRSEISHDDITGEETMIDRNTIAEEPTGEDWQAKASEYLEDWKRTQAEFENYKKRQAASEKELRGYLIEKLVLDIIPVLDNFRSATMHVPAEQKESPWVVGIQYIEKQLESVLTDNGMETIEVKEGEEFDPKLHESISVEEGGEGSGKKHIVAKVLQKGYKFGNRVIRPAKVTIK